MTWAEHYKTLREALGLSLRGTATKAGKTAGYLCRVELGQLPVPPRETRDAFVEAIGLDDEQRAELERLAALERCPCCDARRNAAQGEA